MEKTNQRLYQEGRRQESGRYSFCQRENSNLYGEKVINPSQRNNNSEHQNRHYAPRPYPFQQQSQNVNCEAQVRNYNRRINQNSLKYYDPNEINYNMLRQNDHRNRYYEQNYVPRNQYQKEINYNNYRNKKDQFTYPTQNNSRSIYHHNNQTLKQKNNTIKQRYPQINGQNSYHGDHFQGQRYYRKQQQKQDKNQHPQRFLQQQQELYEPYSMSRDKFYQRSTKRMPEYSEHINLPKKGRKDQQQYLQSNPIPQKITQEYIEAEGQNIGDQLLKLCQQIDINSPFYYLLLQTLQLHYMNLKEVTEGMTDQQKTKIFIQMMIQEKQALQNSRTNPRERREIKAKLQSIYKKLLHKVTRKINQLDNFANKQGIKTDGNHMGQEIEKQMTGYSKISSKQSKKQPNFTQFFNPQSLKRSLQNTKKLIEVAKLGKKLDQALYNRSGKLSCIKRLDIFGSAAMILFQSLNRNSSKQLKQAPQPKFTSQQKRESQPQKSKRFQKQYQVEVQTLETPMARALVNGGIQFSKGITKTYQALFPNFTKKMKTKYSK